MAYLGLDEVDRVLLVSKINLCPLIFHTHLAILLNSIINLWAPESLFVHLQSSFLAKISCFIMHFKQYFALLNWQDY